MLECIYNEVSNQLDCKFIGRMDGPHSKTAETELNNKLADLLEKHPDLNVAFNLSEVEYIASVFIRMCLATAKQVKENAFSIISTNPLIKKTFKIAGLEEILNVS
ncbi:MAG: STAS domain-containing protein [Deltaproteobacteria bacterium]|jgi:anti-anti-sigma factor|nr:STAS domain-containing protein [Deltaproteobacteria bacterium]